MQALLPEGAVTPLQGTRIKTKCQKMETSQEEIVAMNNLYQIADDMEFSSTAFPYSGIFNAWETNEVIQEELFRNIGLALAVVLMIGLLLLANLATCFWVFICVTFTLIDVMGMMYFWGLEINIISAILVIVALGLSVDYAAHLGVMFLTLPGTKQERASKSLGAIGPAVFNEHIITTRKGSTSYQISVPSHLPSTQVDPSTNNSYSAGIPMPDYDEAPPMPPTAGESIVPMTSRITGQSENTKISLEIKITKK
ncbi:protein dispatched homolog 1-like [Branchiostoma floridae]|uniref:Protein dispatched homolog 1-like n=1 Tax=Branchiostoma floridae TaxID=7739 RepID=A0A9J7LZ73_BRAFL|nr:protein dispatched homolog 1-like [Branchiostoma floridae]